MDGPGGYYAKWNKPDTKRKSAWYHLYMECKKVELMKAESRMVMPWAGGWGKCADVGQRYQDSLIQDEKAMELQCTIWWQYLKLKVYSCPNWRSMSNAKPIQKISPI